MNLLRGWTVVRLVNWNGKDLVANRNLGLRLPFSPTRSANLVGMAGWFYLFIYFLIQDLAHGPHKEFILKLHQGDGFRHPDEWSCVEPSWGLCRLFPWCTGKETPSNTLINVLSPAPTAIPIHIKTEDPPLRREEKSLAKAKMSFLIPKEKLLMFSKVCQLWHWVVQEISYTPTFF